MNFNVISFTSQKVTEDNVLNLKKRGHLYGKAFLLKSFTREVEKTSKLRYLFEFQITSKRIQGRISKRYLHTHVHLFIIAKR